MSTLPNPEVRYVRHSFLRNGPRDGIMIPQQVTFQDSKEWTTSPTLVSIEPRRVTTSRECGTNEMSGENKHFFHRGVICSGFKMYFFIPKILDSETAATSAHARSQWIGFGRFCPKWNCIFCTFLLIFWIMNNQFLCIYTVSHTHIYIYIYVYDHI